MIKVTEKLFRGARPKDIRDLIKLDFQLVIDTQSGDEDRFTDSLYEAQLSAERADPDIYPQIEVFNIYCSNIFPPTPSQVGEFLRAVSWGKKALVHCHSGVDRTGFLIAVYRMQRLGWSYAKAYAEWISCGRHWWFDWWRVELKKYDSFVVVGSDLTGY